MKTTRRWCNRLLQAAGVHADIM